MFTIIQSSWRIGVLALVLAAAFLTPAATPRVEAADNDYRAAVREVCLEEGGEFWQVYDRNGQVIAFGCRFPEGDQWNCEEAPELGADQCDYFSAGIYVASEPAQDSPLTATDPVAGELSPDPVPGAQVTDVSSDLIADERVG